MGEAPGPQACEFVVVGAGVLGLSAARALARRGGDVIVLEQEQVGHPGSGSQGSCRIFRLGYQDPWYVSLARSARRPWAELEDECGQRLLLPVPHLTFGAGLTAVREAMRTAGTPCELLPAAAVAARFPGIAAPGPALLEPESCVMAADAAMRALAAAVPAIRTGAQVTGLADDGRQVVVRTDEGAITARAAIVCAGPQTSQIVAAAGIAVPSTATMEQVGYVAPAAEPPPGMPIFISHGAQIPYGLPVPGSPLYKIGFHHGGTVADPARLDLSPDPRLIGELAELARRWLPGYSPDPVLSERCVYDDSPDEDFILDRVGNIVIGSGTSGHGFKFGPLLGEWLADLAGGRPAAEELSRFALRRFRPAAP